MNDPIPMLVGMPVSAESLRKVGVLKYVHSLGAVPAPCDRCAQPTWIGPRQRELKRTRPELEFICANCLGADFKASGITTQDEVVVQSCGGNSGSYFMADGTAILPKPSPAN
jgi:hypothetical protein